MSKQTAVEWLVSEYAKEFKISVNAVMGETIEKAKAMEREQIQSAYKDGLSWQPNDFTGQQQYYDEIYGGDK